MQLELWFMLNDLIAGILEYISATRIVQSSIKSKSFRTVFLSSERNLFKLHHPSLFYLNYYKQVQLFWQVCFISMFKYSNEDLHCNKKKTSECHWIDNSKYKMTVPYILTVSNIQQCICTLFMYILYQLGIGSKFIKTILVIHYLFFWHNYSIFIWSTAKFVFFEWHLPIFKMHKFAFNNLKEDYSIIFYQLR